jgi:DNA-binding LytR/AlgR family response regulator
MNRNIAIIEDQRREAEQLRAYFARFGAQHNLEFSIAHFDDGESFLARYRPVYDVVLMDIMLPGINGMDAAAALRELDPAVTLIFVTNMAQFAVKGYEVAAFDFIVKPVTYPHFTMKLQRALNKLENRQDEQLTLALADRMLRIPVSQIKYVEVSGHRLTYHTTAGTFDIYGSLKAAEAELNTNIFVRCNSCYLVNLNYVQGIDGHDLTVGGSTLQISRAKRKDFIQRLNNYLGGNF